MRQENGMSDGALFSGQQQKDKKRHNTAEGGGEQHEIAERTEKYTFVNVGK